MDSTGTADLHVEGAGAAAEGDEVARGVRVPGREDARLHEEGGV